MPIFRLDEEDFSFPPVHLAEDGIIAVGGDLSVPRLLSAYRNGIFPWFSENEPIIWWSPDPRCVMFPKKVKVSKSMKQLFKKQAFDVTFDQDFDAVIHACSEKRKMDEGTWLMPEMITAYNHLHELGYAHSVEVWDKENNLVGGLYGIAMGKIFFGESMFHRASNASKYGFISLVNKLIENGYHLIDCQVENPHLLSLGAEQMPRAKFLAVLENALNVDVALEDWI